MNEQQAAEMLALLRQIAADTKESKEILNSWAQNGMPPEDTGPYEGKRRKPKVQSALQ
jgi:hypothetical protein